MFLKLFFIFLILNQGKCEELNIQVYYESLCPDSIRFITEQLYPVYQTLGKYMNIEFIIFGNADVSICLNYLYLTSKISWTLKVHFL